MKPRPSAGQRPERRPWVDAHKSRFPLGFPMPSDSSRGALRPTRGRPKTATEHMEEALEPDRRDEEERGVYIISVAARIVEMHPQTLRKYERVGLVTPSRTDGMLRLYSEEDVSRLRLIKTLVDDMGLNLAGVQLALRLFNQLLMMRLRVNSLEGSALRDYLNESLREVFELLQSR